MLKDRKGSRPMLCQMALECGALDFIKSGDDAVQVMEKAVDDFAKRSEFLELHPEAAHDPNVTRVPERIEISTGYVYTKPPTGLENPSLTHSQDAVRIQCWCEQKNQPGVGKVDVRWLVTMGKGAGRIRTLSSFIYPS